MKTASDIRTIAFVGDYLPRKCGIATFTSDLYGSVAAEYPELQHFVIPVNDIEAGYDYPPEVRFEIEEQDLASYRRAVDFLHMSNPDVACVQHEFGIYGGSAGSHLLALLRDLSIPVVTTLHTLLVEPSSEQRRVMEELIQLSARLVVMTDRSVRILKEVYAAPPAKVDLIPHGIPDMPFVDPNFHKDEFGVEGRPVLLTFGLLSQNKGIENVINALPRIVAEFPDVVYIILGATHPNILREQGEAYRLSLERLAKKHGVERNVMFHNQFVDIEQLKEFIGASDIYITPYLHEAQIVSGTLAYAFGMGKAVVSTPYWHAAELLAEERGALVPFGDADAIADEVVGLLKDETRRHAMRKTAYKLGREMVWSNVARMYMSSFEKARAGRSDVRRKRLATKTLDKQPGDLPLLKLDHLLRMTDSTGILQHAFFTVPNYSEGYAVDDNARALILMLMLEELGVEVQRVRSLSSIYAAFLNHSFNARSCRFRNFMNYSREWMEEAGSDDCQGRALWALGACAGRSRIPTFPTMAAQLFSQALPCALELSSPRAWAFALIGIHDYLRKLSGDRQVNQIRDELTSRLMGLYNSAGSDDWPWFEDTLTYVNAKLSHALILSGRWTQRGDVFDAGLRTLGWLVNTQNTEGGYCRPVGNQGFFGRGKVRACFDQQPIEIQATVSACLEAYRATAEQWWYEQAVRAFEWFLGRNDLGVDVYDSVSGGCRDGLHVDRVNQNQGAESTLAFLLSLAEMQLVQNAVATFNKPPQT